MNLFQVVLKSLGLASFVTLGLALNGVESAPESLKRPPNILLDDSSHAVFVDFISQKTKLIFSEHANAVEVRATVTLQTFEEGYPIFDLVQDAGRILLNGDEVSSREILSPHRATRYRILERSLAPGIHEATFHYALKNGFRRSDQGFHLGFWMSDLDDRMFLEQYLPSNLEYDLFELHLTLSMPDTFNDYFIFANGRKAVVLPDEQNDLHIRFPAHYTTSSFFLHVVPQSVVDIDLSEFVTASGKRIPVTIYGKKGVSLSRFTAVTHQTLSELEKTYGEYRHSQVIIYAAPEFGGGMEHAGATITSLGALAHEITHFYFARAMMPANGNAGWIDEAIASWRDARYRRRSGPGYFAENLANHSPYRRTTARAAYTRGRDFLSYLDFRLEGSSAGNGLRPFLRFFLEKNAFAPVTTEDFLKSLELYSGESFADDFNRYVYGDREGILVPFVDESLPEALQNRPELMENPYHPRKSLEDLREFL